MNTIDLKKIISENDLDFKSVANELFPDNKYPALALNRVVKGEAFLDSNQIIKLSELSGVPIETLFYGGKWKTTSKDKEITFTNGDYVAKLNTHSNMTRIFHKKNMIHEAIIHKSTIPLSEYLNQIEKLINNHKS